MTTPVTLFKNHHGNVHVALKSGNTVAFINSKFFTTNKSLEAELQAAADNNNEFGIYVDTNEDTIDPQFATPMDQLKKKLREELLAELKAGGQLVDAGVSRQVPLQLQSSQSVTGQGEASEEQKALMEKQKAELEGKDTGFSALNQAEVDAANVTPLKELTPAEIALAKLKGGN